MKPGELSERQQKWNRVFGEVEPHNHLRQQLKNLADFLRSYGNTEPTRVGQLNYRGGKAAFQEPLTRSVLSVLSCWNSKFRLSAAAAEFLSDELELAAEGLEDEFEEASYRRLVHLLGQAAK